ncbi:MAG: hypothetical protein GQ565_06850 [Candidatus Aegiribacteria sp.]|nr:hypothetical protein [Candidatus Aegiribacteria sp.]
MNEIIKRLSKLAASHKIVPFLGAGTSVNHLNLDWDQISSEMADSLGVSKKMGNIEVASEYSNTLGEEAFCSFLESKLLVEKYSENLDLVPLLVLSMGMGLIYTTNQDNVFEKCVEKYARQYRTVIQLSDLSGYLPGERLFIKYHGDLGVPMSVVFTKESYAKRMNDESNFLNIRMRSDLLTKSFLFIGYSFRDPNVCMIFEEIYKAFREHIPESYLIAYNYTPELEILHEKYGIQIIDPKKVVPDCSSSSEAFEKFMVALCNGTFERKRDDQMATVFSIKAPPAKRVATKYEIDGLESCVNSADLTDSLNLFRATFDITFIPEVYHAQVTRIFVTMCRKCGTKEESNRIVGALFNLKINKESMLECFAATLTTALHRNSQSVLDDMFNPHTSLLGFEPFPLATARAIELINEWGLEFNDSFRCRVAGWINGYEEYPHDLQNYVRYCVNSAWSSKSSVEHPLKSLAVRNCRRGLWSSRNPGQLQAYLQDLMPKKFIKPFDD